MPNLQTKDAVVEVHLDLGDDPPFHFTSTDLTVGRDNRLTFKFGKKDGFKIDYVLIDPVYVYAADKHDALYSTSEASCPHVKGQWSEFTALKVDNNDGRGPALTVHNKNGKSQDFGYTLRITRDGGANYLDLDPIGTNQNSNASRSLVTAAAFFLVGAAVGATAAKFVAPLQAAVSVVGAAVLGGVISLGIYLALSSSRQQRMA